MLISEAVSWASKQRLMRGRTEEGRQNDVSSAVASVEAEPEDVGPHTQFARVEARCPSRSFGLSQWTRMRGSHPGLSVANANCNYCDQWLGSRRTATVRQGVNTRGANGIFFLNATSRDGRLLVTNLTSEGRLAGLRQVTAAIEDEHIYPLLRGRDVQAFTAKPKQFILLPHSAEDPTSPIS